ncbi:hypothetical protein A3F28_03685 [Candidatus Uhrbacteria bacterium RIFCSPHIGHO2_12_FULL_57_11]|uniref:DNA recombination protein RmuC n=2 Tax=Candidatus Uhriibacteriota TaxID=1752732 RepID=A0A1F7UMD1_9BACT|nr:MAG: hypothetical protein A3D72_03010 [Candidatus Uhrbacteria bacterium RIFCSPHIGHO2_02_FULL_57_19]OGL79422.1 MAG: hypothetical protein A3F28_03685 [Candidatus Uhrbacteria bacterium RIFCSPHIGHO2_12_FULL_57_11]
MNSSTILGLLSIIVLILGILVVYFVRRDAQKGEGTLLLHQRLENLNKTLLDQLNAMTQQVNERLKENTDVQQTSSKAVGERLDNAARVVGALRENLGRLETASQHIHNVGKDIASLQEILRAPKLRGGLGELFLGDLLAQILPPAHFTLQYGFKSGEKVDAAIHLRDDRIVPVDAKFPLENFKRMLDAADDDARAASHKLFISDVKKHIDKIANSYILPDEGTFDFALMYIPAENIYYETIIKGTEEHSLMHYAYDRRVIPVSPNTFYVYLQSILLGLRGLQIERGAKEILQNLSRLRVEFGKFSEDFDLVGTHLSRARNSYEESTKRLGRFEEKLELVTSKEEPPPIPLPPVAE